MCKLESLRIWLDIWNCFEILGKFWSRHFTLNIPYAIKYKILYYFFNRSFQDICKIQVPNFPKRLNVELCWKRFETFATCTECTKCLKSTSHVSCLFLSLTICNHPRETATQNGLARTAEQWQRVATYAFGTERHVAALKHAPTSACHVIYSVDGRYKIVDRSQCWLGDFRDLTRASGTPPRS